MRTLILDGESTLIMADIIDGDPTILLCETPPWLEHDAQLNTDLLRKHVLDCGVALKFTSPAGMHTLMEHMRIAYNEKVARETPEVADAS